ncbi:MAG: hypothetical protein F6J94_12090 [Moorea sp. SIO1F2]|nr:MULTISPECIES: hypothetical protein [unclassified Moorena]NEP22461.1 hypothetical protein [Moorena sp. SIO3I6]NET82643.1 hypothetical protein [Moorena sp. SIO1F2]
MPLAFLWNTCIYNPDTNALMRLTLAFWPFGHATRTATLREWSRYANA